METKKCAVCGNDSSLEEIYKKNYDINDLNSSYFDGRFAKNIHDTFVRCNICGLVFSNNIIDEGRLESFYGNSQFTYDDETENLKITYSKLLLQCIDSLPARDNYLDIGCGNGFMLSTAKEMGFKNVFGVEPCKEAIDKCDPAIRRRITEGMFCEEDFKSVKFDLITAFMLLDHIKDVNSFLKSCYNILKDGGYIICVTHDVDGWVHKVFKEKCPIIHIQHFNLFNRKTLKLIFGKNNYLPVEVNHFINQYSIQYWFKMAPLPSSIKRYGEKFLKTTKLGNLNLKKNINNIFIIARKWNLILI